MAVSSRAREVTSLVWMLASRRGAWDELLAATAATTAMAVPLLVVAANIEVFVWPQLLRLASPVL